MTQNNDNTFITINIPVTTKTPFRGHVLVDETTFTWEWNGRSVNLPDCRLDQGRQETLASRIEYFIKMVLWNIENLIQSINDNPSEYFQRMQEQGRNDNETEQPGNR
jgi:hypothetical protein